MNKSLPVTSVRDALRKRYAAPEWALLEEVKNRTGFGGEERYADALAMSLYPSRGLIVHGFEIKTNRGDWLRELKNPDKSVAIQKYCDFWWLVTDAPNIAQKQEIPPNWGLMTLGNGRLNIVKDAPKLEAAPLDRLFVASLLRRAASFVEDADIIKDAKRQGFEAGLAQQEEKVRQARETYERLLKQMTDFQQATGASVIYDVGRVKEAMRVLQQTKKAETFDAKKTLAQVSETLEMSLNFIKSMQHVQELAEGKELHATG